MVGTVPKLSTRFAVFTSMSNTMRLVVLSPYHCSFHVPTQTDAFPLPLSSEDGMEILHGDKKDEAMLPLSPLDAMMHKLGVVLLYIFPRPSSSVTFDLNKLQTSFVTLVTEDYSILMGELHIDPDTGVVSVKQTPESRQRGAQSIRFETNATSSTTTEEAMAALSWELMPTPRGPTELICVKATALSDGGLVVGVDTSHTLLDGEAVFTFMTAWGQHYSGVDQKDRLVINHDRHLLAGTGSSSTLAHPEFQLVESHLGADAGDATAGPAAPLPPPTSQYRFHVTPGMMKRIKNAASQGASATGTSDPSYVSTIDAITALFTALISRARGHGQDVQVTTAINARRRLNPPLPDNYAGNVVFSALSSYKSAELQAESKEEGFISELSLAKLAQRVRGSIRRSDNEYLRDAINFMTEQSNLSAVQPATNFVFGPDIMYTSWVRTGMYDAEFEGTRPWFVSVPPLPLDGFVIITEAARNSPGVDVLVFLEYTAMEKLKELLAHGTYLQDEYMLLSTL